MTSRSRFTPQVLLGLMVIAVGVLFTLDNLDVIDARDCICSTGRLGSSRSA